MINVKTTARIIVSQHERFRWSDLKRLTFGQLEHESETSWYLLLSIGDFVLSYLLFSGGTGRGEGAFEANPVAAWFLNHYGLIKGLLAFKIAMVIFVCLIVQLISLKRPTLGRLLLWLAIATTLYVVIYSLRLLIGA